MIRSGETDEGLAAAAPPTRRRAAFGLMTGAMTGAMSGGLLAPGAGRTQPTPPAAAAPMSAPPASGAQAQAPGAAETLKTGRDMSDRMTTPVYINGQGPFNFFVDTGANRSGIAKEIAALLKLPAGQPTIVHGIAAPALTQTVNVDDLKVGSLHTRLHDAPAFARNDLGADGLIGLDVLHDRVVNMNFAVNRIEVARHIYNTGAWRTVFGQNYLGTTIPAHQRSGQLTIIDAQAGRTKMACFIDTGADSSVGNEALMRAVQAQVPPEKWLSAEVVIRSATGQTVDGIVARVPSMRIGDVHLTNFILAFANLHTFDLWQLQDEPALLVGMNLLRLFDFVTIDFAESQVTLEKN